MTEDEQPLDMDAAEQGLVLRLAPAGKGRAEEATAATDPGAVQSHMQLRLCEAPRHHWGVSSCAEQHALADFSAWDGEWALVHVPAAGLTWRALPIRLTHMDTW